MDVPVLGFGRSVVVPRPRDLLGFFSIWAVIGVHATEAPSGSIGLGRPQLVDQAIRQHPSMAAARYQIESGRAGIRGAKPQHYPNPSLQRQQGKEEGDSVPVVSLQQPLWAGDRHGAGVDAANARAEAANFSASDTSYALDLRVIAAWEAWLQARGWSDALSERVTVLNLYAESVRRQIERGAAGEVDRELVDARLAQTAGDLASTQSAERSGRARLGQLVGHPLRPEELRFSSSAEPVAPQPPLATLTALALDCSAALRRRQAEIEPAGGELEQRCAALWPTVSLSAQQQRLDKPKNGLSKTENRVMLVLKYAPGTGLSTNADIDAAAANELERRMACRASESGRYRGYRL